MESTKEWWKSKTIITSIISGLIGIYLSLVANGVALPAIPAWLVTILSAMGIYGRVQAEKEISGKLL